MNFLHQGFQKLSSDRHIYTQTDRQTYGSEITYHATLCMVNNNGLLQLASAPSLPMYSTVTAQSLYITDPVFSECCFRARSILRKQALLRLRPLLTHRHTLVSTTSSQSVALERARSCTNELCYAFDHS